jgi:hypothetical protein
MKRWTILLLSILTTVAVGTAAPASADSPHFKKGGTPTCTVGTTGGSATASCTGTLAGLGNEDVVIQTTLQGFATYTCTNQGGNAAPGQNKVNVGPTTTPTTIPAGSIKNGTLTYTAGGSLSAPSTVTGQQAGCPNNNWTGTNPQLTVTSITEQIYQGGVLLFTCTASNRNGLSGTVALSC